MTAQAIGEVTGKIVERWTWYETALQHPEWVGTGKLPIHEDEPQQGYFRVRRKDSPWEAVALFFPEGSDQIVAYRDGREVRDVNSLWVWCCRQPIEYAAYEKAMAGNGWDDEPPVAPGIGDNSGEADPFDALRIEFLGEKEQAEEILKKGIHTQDDADRASIWKDRMLKIRSRAEAEFKKEKQPILDEGKRIDDKWRFLAHKTDSETTAMAEKLRLGMEGFLKAKKAEEEARQRKAREEAAAAQRAAAEAARKAQESDQQSEREREAARQEADRLAAQARAAEQEAEARSVNAGRTGARTTIRVEKKGEIVDQDAFYKAVRDRTEVTDLLQSLANRAAKSGFELPGMKIVEIEKVV